MSINKGNKSRLSTDTLARVSKDTFYLIIGQVLSKIFSFAYILLLARILPVDDFGKFNLVMSFVLIAEIGSDFGLSRLMVRDIARDKDIIPKYLGGILPIRIPLSIIMYVVTLGILLIAGYSEQIIQLTAIAGLALWPYSVAAMYGSTIHARQHFVFMAFTQVFFALSQLVLGVIALYTTKSLGVVLAMMVVSHCVQMTILHYGLRKRGYRFSFHWDWPFCKRILSASSPFMVMAMLTVVASRAEILTLSWFVADSDIALYGAAVKIPEALIFFPLMFAAVLSPMFARLHHESREALSRLYNWSANILLLLVIPASFIGYLFADPVFTAFFTEKYAESIPFLKYMLLVFPLTAFQTVNACLLYASDYHKQAMILFGILLFIQYLLNFKLIGAQALDGAVWAFMLAQFVNLVITTVVVQKWFLSGGLTKALIPPVASALLLVVAFLWLPIAHDYIRGGIAILCFAVSAFILTRVFPTPFDAGEASAA